MLAYIPYMDPMGYGWILATEWSMKPSNGLELPPGLSWQTCATAATTKHRRAPKVKGPVKRQALPQITCPKKGSLRMGIQKHTQICRPIESMDLPIQESCLVYSCGSITNLIQPDTSHGLAPNTFLRVHNWPTKPWPIRPSQHPLQHVREKRNAIISIAVWFLPLIQHWACDCQQSQQPSSTLLRTNWELKLWEAVLDQCSSRWVVGTGPVVLLC